ncbi:MAG: 3-isopropylmalate/(R)-2-methylmalate dehydratase large subunit [Candidatus Atribacteria bacterium]|nr:3-isopropylmalate/(R)-2-methylmalate dehydratase large subunit [Candidatus Atribacteria bacterium]
MGKTMAEKILSKKSNTSAKAGDLVVAQVDLAMGQDGTTPLAIRSFEEMGGKGVFDPDRIILVIDHNAPSPLEMVSRLHDSMRNFSQKYGVKLFDVGCGVCHELMVAQGLVVPGDLVIGADSHTCTYGALGAFSTGVGSTELAAVMIGGKLWFKVPETIKVNLVGQLPPGVFSKDVILHLAGKLGADGATYRSLEFYGPVIDNLEVEERLTISNMAVEVGAKTGLIPPDEKTIAWVKQRSKREFEPVYADSDAHYIDTITLDCSSLSPQIALPHRVDQVSSVEEINQEIPIQEAFLGTCTNGRAKDIEVAARILTGKKIDPRVRLIVAPASREIFMQAVKAGWVEAIVEAGGTFVTPGCGPCVGTHQGVPGDGWNVISTANRNFKGRMGNNQAFIYLGSPATVAASALEGKIADPRKYLEG